MVLYMGISHLRDGTETQAAIPAEMAIVGIIGTAPNANAELIPLNKAIEIRTSNTTLRAALGSTGTIVDALNGLSAQLTGNIGAARCVIVRVADDADAFNVIANIVGSEANKTGVWQFLSAPPDLGVTPRLLIAPGFTSQSKQGVAFDAITTPGSGGANGTFALGFSGGTGTGAAGTFTVTGGAITAVTITNPGVYTVLPTATFTASAGLTGAAVALKLEQLANPVCALMPTICERLKGYFIPEGPTSSRQAALNWLETLPRSARILHPLRQDAKVMDADGDIVTKPLSPYVVGKYVSRDASKGGVPSHSAANMPMYGLVGVNPVIPMSITDESVEGQADVGVRFGIVFRGDVGVDGALTDGGFTFWGTDTLSEQSEWLFANVNRLRDYIELLQVRAIRVYLGNFNITYQTVDAIINTIKSQLVQLQAQGAIIDFRVTFNKDANTPENLRLGYLDLEFKAEEPPVLRKITMHSHRYRDALVNLTRNISIMLGSAA